MCWEGLEGDGPRGAAATSVGGFHAGASLSRKGILRVCFRHFIPGTIRREGIPIFRPSLFCSVVHAIDKEDWFRPLLSSRRRTAKYHFSRRSTFATENLPSLFFLVSKRPGRCSALLVISNRTRELSREPAGNLCGGAKCIRQFDVESFLRLVRFHHAQRMMPMTTPTVPCSPFPWVKIFVVRRMYVSRGLLSHDVRASLTARSERRSRQQFVPSARKGERWTNVVHRSCCPRAGLG